MNQAGLLEHFEPGLLLFSSTEGIDKTKPEFFALAAKRAGIPSRIVAFTLGKTTKSGKRPVPHRFRVAFHPLHVFDVIEQMPNQIEEK